MTAVHYKKAITYRKSELQKFYIIVKSLNQQTFNFNLSFTWASKVKSIEQGCPRTQYLAKHLDLRGGKTCLTAYDTYETITYTWVHHMKVAKRSLLPPTFNLKMAAVGSPQMFLNFYHIAWHHIPEDSTICSACMSWNFKPYVQWRAVHALTIMKLLNACFDTLL